MGHTAGPASVPAIEPRHEIPLTLDLRRPRP
jgi:hypothetical protein